MSTESSIFSQQKQKRQETLPQSKRGNSPQWSYDELLRRTDQILDEVHGLNTRNNENATASDNNSVIIREDDCFRVLEAWMELARDHSCRRPSSSRDFCGIHAAQKAQMLLEALEQNDSLNRKLSLVPKASFYDVVLQSYAVSGGGLAAAEAAQELLRRMLSKCREFGQQQQNHQGSTRQHYPPPEPTIKSFNIVMNCWAKSASKESGLQAERILEWMATWTCECKDRLAKDVMFPYHGCIMTEITLASVINSWARSGHALAPKRSLELLNEVVAAKQSSTGHSSFSKHRDGYQNVKLDEAVFNSVILAWIRSGRGREAAIKAEEILCMAVNLHDKGLVTTLPSSKTYALVLDAWARCEESIEEGARRAQDILNNMVRLYREGLPLRLNAVTFATCVMAWSRCRGYEDAPERAEEVLETLITLYEETEDPNLKPDLKSWNCLLAAWSNATSRSDSIDRSFKVLERSKQFCQPDAVSYSIILNALAKRGLGEKALIFWQEIPIDSIRYHVLCCNGLLAALSKEKRPDFVERTQTFFEKMDADERSRLDVVSFTLLISTWSRSANRLKADRAHALLYEMTKRYQAGDLACKPDVRVVTVAIKTIAETKGSAEEKQRALDLALDIFQKCEEFFGVKPNHMVFSTILVAVNCLARTPQKRHALLDAIFDRCCSHGQLSSNAVTSMSRGGLRHRVEQLDSAWSRNVPNSDRPSKLNK